MSILHKQAEIIEEFDAIEQWEDRYKHIISIGRALPALAEEHMTEDNKVRGCSSSVWLIARKEGDKVIYEADSDAMIVRGLVSLIVRVFSGEQPAHILAASPDFIEELGLNQNLSANRANGLAAMVKKVKTYALAFQAQS